jgi:hypothetical protein
LRHAKFNLSTVVMCLNVRFHAVRMLSGILNLINGTGRLDASFYVLNALAVIVYYRRRSVSSA